MWFQNISDFIIQNIETSALAMHPTPLNKKISNIEGIPTNEATESEYLYNLGSDQDLEAYITYLHQYEKDDATDSVCGRHLHKQGDRNRNIHTAQ